MASSNFKLHVLVTFALCVRNLKSIFLKEDIPGAIYKAESPENKRSKIFVQLWHFDNLASIYVFSLMLCEPFDVNIFAGQNIRKL